MSNTKTELQDQKIEHEAEIDKITEKFNDELDDANDKIKRKNTGLIILGSTAAVSLVLALVSAFSK